MSADHGSPPVLPEPQTPSWLTVLGAVLFLCVGVWWLATSVPHSGAGSTAEGDGGTAAAPSASAP